MSQLTIIGGGFAGVWAAFSAARLVRQHRLENEMTITLINKDEYHGLRPRYYENDLSTARIPLRNFLEPLGIALVIGEVSQIDYTSQHISVNSQDSYHYDRLILAAGSHLYIPELPGLKEHAFNIDTFHAAKKLQAHIESLPSKNGKGQYTLIVIGGGFTGIEAATDFMDRLKKIAPKHARVIVIDRTEIGSGFSKSAQEVILKAFKDMGIEMLSNARVKQITKDHVELDSGEMIHSQTVVWTAGMQSNELTKSFGLALDRLGRLPVDRFLRIQGINHCFAAGDVAAATTDGEHMALLSCQHAMPQGRFAGNNAIADLLGKELDRYEQPKYVTSLDLGSWGALYCEGWDQQVIAIREPAKKIKLFINHNRIYPPTVQNGIETLLDAAEPTFKAMKF